MGVTPQTVDERDARRNGSSLIMAGVVLAVVLYPFALAAFHETVEAAGASLAGSRRILAGLWLAVAFAVPAMCLFCAIRMASQPIVSTNQQKALRLSYFGVVAPTAYTFMGVVLYMLGSPVADEWVWVAAWLALAAWAFAPSRTGVLPAGEAPTGLRVAHGAAATLIILYVLFHVVNHLFGLLGPEEHAAVMKMGRRVYRAPIVEPILVTLLLFQVGSGMILAWRWSGRPAEAFRVFQVASGFYLSLFVLGHMNSVFVFARTYLKIDTGWGFATGAPTGLIHDGWNIRLVPHYWLGVFFVLSHLVTGLRVVLSAHGSNQVIVSRIWAAGIVGSAIMASLILAGMCGLRLPH